MPGLARFRWLLVASVLLALWTGSAGAQDETTVRLSPVDAEEFPTITLFISVADAEGQRISGLSAASFRVIEDNVALPPPQVDEIALGTRQVFVISTSEGMGLRDSRGRTRLDLVRDSLFEWWQLPEASELGIDDLTLITTEGTLVGHGTSTAQLASTLDQLEPTFESPGGEYDLLLQALDFLDDPLENPGMASYLVFVSTLPALPEESTLTNIASLAEASGTAIYPVLVGPPESLEDPTVQAFDKLAQNSGGRLIQFESEEGLLAVADQILDQRSQYQLMYNSRAVETGTHEIQVQIVGDGVQSISAPTTYDVTVRSPEVIFVRPPNEIMRAFEDGDGEQQFLVPSTSQLELVINFPDGHPRPVVLSQLLIDDEVAATMSEPPFDRFRWDLTQYNESGEHNLQAVVTDSLGLTGESEEQMVRIEVESPDTGLFAAQPSLGYLLAALAILGAGILLAVVLLSPQRVSWLTQTARSSPPPIFNRFRRATLSAPPEVEAIEAYIVPILADGEEGAAIPLTGTDLVLGRDASLSPIPTEDPSVSGLHARLTRKAGGDYVLKDQGSIAGTWVNYEPIPQEGIRLRHDDLVHLGRVSFRFRLPEVPAPYEVRITPASGGAQPNAHKNPEEHS